MNTSIAFATLAAANKISDESNQIGPLIIILSIVAFSILVYIFAQKPNAYKEKEKRWDLGAQEREKELMTINENLSGKKLIVIIRTPDRKSSNIESVLIQILIDSGAKIIRLTRDEGDEMLYGNKDLGYSCHVITGIMKTDETTHDTFKHTLDLRIWNKETEQEHVYRETAIIVEEKVEWLLFAFLQHVSSGCKD